MARRFGLEEMRGLAGESLVSAESLRYQKMADDLCAQRKPVQALPFMRKAMQDKNNVDIYVSYAFVQPSYRQGLEVLMEGKLRGERSLESRYGPDTFKDDGPFVGRFYEVMDTRPYMRVLQAIVRVAVECKKYDKAVDTIIEMFRLNPQDPMQQHKWLPTLLCRTKRYADALYFCQLFIDIFLSRIPLSALPPGGGAQFRAPRRDLYTEDEQARMKIYESTILYSAALATFHMSGDCQESRMYLRAAAKANPVVLTKILKKTKRPEFLDSSARSYNSPADAHDYLWLSHDLWMEKEVWSWLNSESSSDAQQAVRKSCTRPGCGLQEREVGEFPQCSGCQTVSYCTPGCQKGDWKRHKPDCTFEQQAKSMRRAIAKGRPVPTGTIPVFAADFSENGIQGCVLRPSTLCTRIHFCFLPLFTLDTILPRSR
ncbi:hypothetical protein BT96DRAFT_822920 [Gymnopus androsaceus JB14]|uniref:MYND-type domain-containing protein n=1 Tax=Gymnopus androsaceus JB14 TaxID=1447944 RepID=A0A6A4HIC8_9AGAR|nr:hypothetical protein BT96DRAFT_822920 [Gymnopus androsaceus JB14]